MVDKLGISTPWMTFAREVDKLFEKDPEVTVFFDNDDLKLEIRVANAIKADALTKIVPTEQAFGNIIVKVSVVPANVEESQADLYRRAFEGNPAVRSVETVRDMFGSDISYVVFEPEVVQFENDNIGDVNGYSHTLFQEIAKEFLLGNAGIRFCTGLRD